MLFEAVVFNLVAATIIDDATDLLLVELSTDL